MPGKVPTSGSACRKVALLPLLLLVGCQEAESGNLRESYEQMIASAERQPANGSPGAHFIEVAPPRSEPTAQPEPAAPAEAPPAGATALPIDAVFSTSATPSPEPERTPTQAPVAERAPVAARDTEPTPPAARDAEPEPFAGTAGIQHRARSGMSPQTLRAVRTAAHPGFDRVVFQLDGSVPGYHIEYIDRPVRECGSGRTLPVAGQGWLRVRLDPARAHEQVDGFAQATVASRNRPVDHNTVLQLVLTCDTDTQVEWVIGVAAPNRYRVLELTEPARLVVDVLH